MVMIKGIARTWHMRFSDCDKTHSVENVLEKVKSFGPISVRQTENKPKAKKKKKVNKKTEEKKRKSTRRKRQKEGKIQNKRKNENTGYLKENSKFMTSKTLRNFDDFFFECIFLSSAELDGFFERCK